MAMDVARMFMHMEYFMHISVVFADNQHYVYVF